jgi:hypothetical protein
MVDVAVVLTLVSDAPPAKVEVAVSPRIVVVLVFPTATEFCAEKTVDDALVSVTNEGREMVTDPVAPETDTWFAVPASAVTPVLVMVRPEPMMAWFAVTEMPAPDATVPVATPWTSPFVPGVKSCPDVKEGR